MRDQSEHDADLGLRADRRFGRDLRACPVPGLDRCNNGNKLSSFTVTIDDTNSSHVYVAYAVNTLINSTDGAGNDNVIVQDSTDGGVTWAAAHKVTVSSGGSARRFMPWICATNGTAYVSWYDRRLNPNSALTDVCAATEVDPRITSTPKSNTRVTDFSSNWLAVSSIIVPNFGDYTDNFVVPVPKGGASGGRLFAAWSDGRVNVPQPFASSAGLKK